MLGKYERGDFWSTFTVFGSGQFLTFPEMSLKLIPLPQEHLFIGFKHPWVYIHHNYALLRFFVTFQNFDLALMFCLYWKRDESDIAFNDGKSSISMPSKIYEVIWGCQYRITCP